MPYIGNTVQNQGFTPAIDYFNGNGVTVTFTLSRPIASVAQVIVAVDNVIQNPSSAFNVVGNSITFTSAPLSGTNNIWVEYTSLITTYQGISQDPTVIGDIRATGGYLAEGDFGNSYIDGTIVDYVTGNARITTGPVDNMTFYHGGTSGRSEMMELYYAGGAKVFGTTALTIPVGTTGERPTGAAGMTRFNSTTSTFEVYNGTVWVNYTPTYSVEYLVIAGGGGGGGGTYHGAGGGAGGYRSSVSGESSGGGALAEQPLPVLSGVAYTVTVGAGGAGVPGTSGGSSGDNSVFGSITSIGGGKGGTYNGDAPFSGGSGGGADYQHPTPGSGTTGQGYAGGTGTSSAPNYGSGGGGGAGSAGVNGTSTTGGNGGNGVSSSITGSAVTRGGGGGGSTYNGGTAGSGGAGGGGAGSVNGNNQAGSGTANTGGGGGGAERSTFTTGGAGGSGIVIIRYLGAQRGTGGTVTSSGGYTIHTFTSSGTYTA